MNKFKLNRHFAFALILILLTASSITLAQRQRITANSSASKQESAAQGKSAGGQIANNTDSKWFELSDANGEIVVSFPAQSQEREIDGSDSTASHTAYFANLVFNLTLHDMRETREIKMEPIYLNKFASSYAEVFTNKLRHDGWRIIYYRATATNKNEMEAWFPSSLAGKYLHQLSHQIMKNGWLYNLSCGSIIADQKVDPALCQKFFDSVRFVPKVDLSFQWYKFTSSDKDFTLLSPALLSLRRIRSLNTSTKITRYSGTALNHYFDVGFFERDAAPNDLLFNQLEKDYESIVRDLYQSRGMQIIKAQRLAKNESEFEVWHSSSNNSNLSLHGFERAQVHRGRFYLMNCTSISFKQVADRDLCHRFFNGLQLVERKK